MAKGISTFSNELTNNFPIPFQPKIYSTKTAPESIEANQPDVVVNTGIKEFLKACFTTTLYSLRPFALATLTKLEERESNKLFLVKLTITAIGRIPKVNAGRIKFLILNFPHSLNHLIHINYQ